MNINKDGMVPLQSIYDDVISHYNWQNYDESKRRLLRKKYAFLQRNLVLCSPSEFKSKGDNVIPLADAAIVRDILIEAVNDGEDNMIYDWFNGRVDTTDSLKAKLLFMCMKPVIMRSNVMTGETDDVTADEWLNTVSAALNANTADNTLRLKRHLEEFRNSSLALNMNISVGDITVTHADGHRSYGLRGQKPSLDIRGKTIDEILENIICQDDYFSVLDQMLEVFTNHAKQQVRNAIEWYADAKDLCEAEKADDAVARDSIASEYVIWYQRIHEFLRDNPEICREIEEKSNTTGLVDFFKMQNRE